MSIKKIYIGAICDRDLEFFERVVKFVKVHYNIKIVNLLPNKRNKTNLFNDKYIQKKIKKYPLSLIIVKLRSQESNEYIYTTLRKYAPNIPFLNSLNAVQTCESRKATFQLINENYKKIKIPQSYFSFKEAYDACNNDTKLIIKYDIHNAPDFSKEDRIIGIARDKEEFKELIRNFDPNHLFFQEYLGKIDIIYKVYVIDKWVVCITAHNWLRHRELTPLELVHIRVPLDKELKRKILKLGRKFGMSIFGVDFIINKDGIPYVIDINDFPSFRNIPEATSLISDYIYEFLMARQKVIGKIPMKLKTRTYMI